MSEIGRCRDCRFWSDEPAYDASLHVGAPFGTCTRIGAAPVTLACTDPSDPYIEAPLRTRPAFGCVLWEAAS
jgi:hypothetical protein